MRRFRFHIGTLVILVLVLGVSFAALRESNEIWDSGVFTLTVAVLLTSILLAIYRTEKRRAFWVGFAIFGAGYLGLSLIPSIEPRLITTKALSYLASKVPRSISNGVGLAYFDYDNDGDIDLYLVNNSQPGSLYRNQGNGKFHDVTATVGFNQLSSQGAIFRNTPSGLWLVGNTENFVRIGHSLVALIAAYLGGKLSRRLYDKGRQPASGSASRLGSNPDASGG
jgi:hypothetical protein